MTKPLVVRLDPEEFDKLPPTVQEALWRLARKDQPVQDARTPNERLRGSIKPGESEADFVKRVAKSINPNGSINIEPELKPAR